MGVYNETVDTYPIEVYTDLRKIGEIDDTGGFQMENEVNCCHKTKKRTEEEYRCLLNRLNRIEGQIRGIKNMVERDAYCTDILTQVAAAGAALNSFSKELLSSHIRTCVADDIRNGKDETIDELVDTIRKLMR